MQNAKSNSANVVEPHSHPLGAEAGKYLTFKLAAEEYGLEILTVKEIIGLLNITRMPRVPEYIRGIINLRGKVIPVLDLRSVFGLEKKEDTDETCIIVVEISNELRDKFIGLLVDGVSEVVNIGENDIEETPAFGSNVRTDMIQGMGKVGERLVMLLNIDNIINNGELGEAIESLMDENN